VADLEKIYRGLVHQKEKQEKALRHRLQATAVRARSPAAAAAAVRTATARRARSAADLAELRPASWLIALIPLLHSILIAMSCGKIDLKPCLLACSSEV